MFKLVVITGDCENGKESHRKTKRYHTVDEAAYDGYGLSPEYDFKVIDLTTGKPVPVRV